TSLIHKYGHPRASHSFPTRRSSDLAERFAREGAHVCLVDLNEDAARNTAREIVQSGGKAASHVCDVANQKAATELFRRIARENRSEERRVGKECRARGRQ